MLPSTLYIMWTIQLQCKEEIHLQETLRTSIGHMMSRVLGNILGRSRSNNVFFCKCIFSLTMGCSNIKLCWYKVPANKLCLFYQMDTGVSPNYLSSLIPASVEDSTIYNLRNANNLRHTLTRTQLYNRPFYPPRAWNELALEVRQSS